MNTHVYVTGLPDDVTMEEVSGLVCLALFDYWTNRLILKEFSGGRSFLKVRDHKGGGLNVFT